jgi:23S rRNA (pseudouridine1915-N3)-methyltransferase
MRLLFFINNIMKISLFAIAHTDEDYLKVGIKNYIEKISRYYNFEYHEIPALKNIKNISVELQKEAEVLMQKIKASDYVILLDENGKQFSSENFANNLQLNFNKGLKNIVFVIGGPFGFGTKMYERANEKNALSSMTFSHQMIRLFFTEQLYRACTILRGEKYHHV